MKYWLAIGLLLIATTAQADRPTVTVEVVGHGVTVDDARRNGFRSAVELAVGSVVVTDSESRNSDLTKDQIGSYSSGYVENYRILETSQDSTGYQLKMQVTVGHSKIAERMLSRGEQSQLIDGDQLQAQMESGFDQRARGDQLIAQILASYPQNTFILNSGRTEFKVSNQRMPYVEIPFFIEMNDRWVAALSEALDLVSMKNTSCGGMARMITYSIANNKIRDRLSCGQVPDLRVNNKNYYFYDQLTLRMINSEFQPVTGAQRIALHVAIQDAAGYDVDHRCVDVNTTTFFKYNQPEGVVNMNDRDMILRPEILGDKKIKGVLNINLSNLKDVSDIAKIKLTVEKTCT
jgi:hypothetical protein